MTRKVDGHSDPCMQSIARPMHPPSQGATIFGGSVNGRILDCRTIPSITHAQQILNICIAVISGTC